MEKPTRGAVTDGPPMNPLITVGTLRGSSGISAWRSIAHRTPSRAPCSFEYRFKKRLPPAPTLQAGYWLRCYEKAGWMARGTAQIVGNSRAASRQFRVSSYWGRASTRRHLRSLETGNSKIVLGFCLIGAG